MGTPSSKGQNDRASQLFELLLSAIGSPPEKRVSLTVSQKNCCAGVRNKIFETWRCKLLHLPEGSSLSGFPRRLLSKSLDGRIGGVHSPPYGTISSSRTVVPAQESAGASQTPSMPSDPAPPSCSIGTDKLERVKGGNRTDAPGGNAVSRWADVEIDFLSEHRVQISRAGRKAETLNYGDFGFCDGRNENPNLAWAMLRVLAENRGIISSAKSAGVPWPEVEKRIQKIRKVLRQYFHLSSDPIVFVRNSGYEAQFKIRCAKSFRF
jgi:hypothetical protein